MRKLVITVLLVMLALLFLNGFARGIQTNNERAKIIQQCDADPSCTYVHVQK